MKPWKNPFEKHRTKTFKTGKQSQTNNLTLIKIPVQTSLVIAKMKAVIIDLDDTISEPSPMRKVFWNVQPRNIKASELLYEYDEFKVDVWNQLDKVPKFYRDIFWINESIIIMTARSNTKIGREKTIKWLENNNIPYAELIMRPCNDHSSDEEAKKYMFRIIQSRYDVIAAYDDKKANVNMFLSEGVENVYHVTGIQVEQIHKREPPGTIELMDSF